MTILPPGSCVFDGRWWTTDASCEIGAALATAYILHMYASPDRFARITTAMQLAERCRSN